MIILYTIGCPKCNILKNKLDQKGIEYVTCTSVDEMKKAGIESRPFPMLKVGDQIMDFHDANKWVNEWKDVVDNEHPN